MRRLQIGWLLLSLVLAAGCSASRGDDIGGFCGPDAGSCPAGTTCQDGRCVEEQPSRTSLSASGRLPGGGECPCQSARQRARGPHVPAVGVLG